jgi:hypothetical protein
MVRLLLAVLLGVIITGCATYWQAHTEGTSGPIAWYITDAKAAADRVGERYAYSFVLVLQETQGTPLTFTTLTYTVYSGSGGIQPGRYGRMVALGCRLRILPSVLKGVDASNLNRSPLRTILYSLVRIAKTSPCG